MRLTVLFLCCVLAGCAREASSTLLPAGESYGTSVAFHAVGYKSIFSFKFDSTTSGSFPQGALLNLKGTLYGTTQGGGAHSVGTVFTLTPAGAQKILYSFKGGKDGANPMYGSLVAVKGVLYGTTSRGGSANFGTVFKITTGGAEKAIYAFKGGKDGTGPDAGLTDVGGVLYGTTVLGGSDDDGTVFRVTTGGAEKVIHAFTAQSNDKIDGAIPEGAMIAVKGTLYGTTKNGGTISNDGTVFTISTSGKEKVIHTFAGHDGQYPYGGLTYVNGALYGTTCNGGANASQGTVFKMSTSGDEAWTYSFKGSDGACPGYGNLTLANGALYGTTTKGGKGTGTVYRITTSRAAKVLHVFQATNANDGAVPNSGLTLVGKSLYGTTSEGGGAGYDGTAYTIKP